MQLAHDPRFEITQARPRAARLSVLLVVPWDQESGGIASVVGYLARYLEAQDHRVVFLHPGVSEFLRYKKTKWGFDGVELNLRSPVVPGHRFWSVCAFIVTLPLTMLQLLRLLRVHDIRVVNIHFPGPSFVYFAFCRWLLPIRLVVSIHGTDVLPWDAPASRPPRLLGVLLRAADLIISPSWGFLRKCSGVLASSSARRIAIHNGIDLAELESSASARADAAEAPFILSVASHDEWKGLDVLLRAMALLREGDETVRLVLAGDGPLRSELQQLAASLHVDEQVQFIGYQSRPAVARLLNECMLFVLPSRYESLGIAVVEALACGKPVVATAVDGIPEIIEDGTNGILVEPEDARALAAAIRRLLGDADLRARLGRAGRLRVKDAFRWQRMGESYVNAYEQVLEPGAHDRLGHPATG
jgi:glycosyltransferase involved in cell wall biosynthesis